MRKLFGVMLAVAIAVLPTAGCVAHRHGEPSPAEGFGQALGYLIFSPVLIVAGLIEGIASAPYLIEADLHDMNREMERSNANVSLDRTYRYAYGRNLESVPKSGDTGKVFRHMSEATGHFQGVLRGYGVEDYDRYVLTAVRTADRHGYTLYALVYRPTPEIRVLGADGRLRLLTPADRDYYRPYERDAGGQSLDVVLDWAGVPRSSIKTQKGQAILLTLAANSVLINRRSDGYWEVERRWVAGDFERIVAERKAQLDGRMALSS